PPVGDDRPGAVRDRRGGLALGLGPGGRGQDARGQPRRAEGAEDVATEVAGPSAPCGGADEEADLHQLRVGWNVSSIATASSEEGRASSGEASSSPMSWKPSIASRRA